MTTITGATGTPSTASSYAGSKLAGDFDTFLQILVAQLQNQDPLSPMDSTEFVSQLAEFSNVEQNIATNQNLENVLAALSENQDSGAIGYIGKDVTAITNMLPLHGQDSAEFSYALPQEANKVFINIMDSDDKVIRTYEGDPTAGNHEMTWDGKDSLGNDVAEGIYRIEIFASDGNGDPVEGGFTTVKTTVTGVNYDGVNRYLVIPGGGQLSLEQILTVSQPQVVTETASE